MTELLDAISAADLSGWLTPQGKHLHYDGHHTATILKHDLTLSKGLDYVALGYSRIEGHDANDGTINIECIGRKLSSVRQWLRNTLTERPKVVIELHREGSFFVEMDSYNST